MANQNPASLTDEELDAALEELGVDVPPTPETKEEPEEPKTPPAPKEEVETPEEEQPEEEVEEEPEEQPEEKKKPDNEPSRREQLRIQDLLRKYPPPQEAQPQAPAPQKAPEGLLNLDTELDADDALKERLKADRALAAKVAADEARSEVGKTLAQEKASLLFHTRLEVDAPRVEMKYPALDKTSDQFKPALANAINTMYLDAVGYNYDTDTVSKPNVRYTDFVEALYELGYEMGSQEIEKKVEVAKKNVVKQAAQTGLRPDGNAPKKLNLNKLPHQMTDEELDAAIAQGLTSR